MKRIRIVGLCVLAACAMTAVVASAAQAAPEYKACLKLKKAEGKYSNSTCTKVESKGKGKYELGSATGVTYTSKTGEAVLSTPDLGGKVTCEKSKDKGKITGPTTDEDQVTFEKCTTEGKKCSSKGETGKKAGTIVTAKLETKLVEKEGKPAVEFVSKSGPEGYQAEFDCEGLLIRTKGYTIGVITSPEEGVYSLKTDVKFAGEENLLTEVSIDGGKEYLGPFPSEEKVEGVDTNKSALAVSGGGGGRVPRWWVEGALLAGTEPLAETTTTVAPFKLLLTQEKDSVEIGTVECSEVKLHGAQIEAPSGRSEKDVEYAGCKVLEPHSAVENAKCEVQDRAIVTNELQATLEGPLKHEKLEFKPKAGKELGSFFIIGAGCSFAGEFKADGDMVCGYPKVEEEKVEHVLEFTGTSGSDVTLAGPDGIGTNPTDGVTVTYEDHLASHKLYSAF